jgi:hypothetical protein
MVVRREFDDIGKIEARLRTGLRNRKTSRRLEVGEKWIGVGAAGDQGVGTENVVPQITADGKLLNGNKRFLDLNGNSASATTVGLSNDWKLSNS